MAKSIIQKLQNQIIKFRDERRWAQFDNPKDMAISLSIEAAEVLEHFQWKSKEEIEKYVKEYKEHIGEELSDVLYWILLISHDLDIDIAKALTKKMKKNEEKYPVKKAKGSAKKWSEL